MDANKVYQEWLESDYFDSETKAELLAIKDDPKEIEDRFYRELEFGTAGLRGVIGAGLNRMNIYTVRKATQGLANYILSQGTEKMGVAIAYDSRHMSPEFADEAALCLAANGIKAYVFTTLRPTPELSFAVRALGCTAGINITASHNPKEYNGYKVYWADGAQITPPHDVGIMDEVRNVTDFSKVKTMSMQAALAAGFYVPIDDDVDKLYDDVVESLVIRPDMIAKYGSELKIVYSPLHGTGYVPVMRILKKLGFENVYVVPEQAEPDGDFPSVSAPNPENDEAFVPGLALANKIGADLVLATDPDADRIGVMARDPKTGEFHAFNGNMSGSLLAEYVITSKKELGTLPADAQLIESIVSSKLAKAIAEKNGCGFIEVLTGFKYIGLEILRFEKEKSGSFVFGFEESYGSLMGTYARDKDAVAAAVILCEAAAYYKSKDMTLWDEMLEIYKKYGWYRESVKSVTMPGIDGLREIAAIYDRLCANPIEEIGGLKVLKIRNYSAGTILDMATKETAPTGLPISKALYYELENDAWVAVRPSGTEPKIKYYFGIKGADAAEAEALEAKMKAAMEELK